jgi:hypothetical protein
MGGGCKVGGFVDFSCVGLRLGAGRRQRAILSGDVWVPAPGCWGKADMRRNPVRPR